MNPDESLFKQHLGEALFQIGVDDGSWGLCGTLADIQWPCAVLWCKATPKESGQKKYYFRFTLDGYSASAPTAVPWDINKNQPLEHAAWPRWTAYLQKVFNPGWNNGTALYAPCDRKAMQGHEKWKEQHSAFWWFPGSNIVKYLRFLYRLLNSGELNE